MRSHFSAPPIEVTVSDSCQESLNAMLEKCVEIGASDLHLSAGQPPIYRLNGEIVRDEVGLPMEADFLEQLPSHMASGMNTSTYQATGSLDGAVSSRTGAIECHFNSRGGTLSFALRSDSCHWGETGVQSHRP